MRALLVVNPKATATSFRERDVLIRALGSDLKVDLAETTHRGHAISYGAQAVEQGHDLVVVLGGDGTINEVVNGLLGSGEHAAAAEDVPALAVVPGGSTNVFSRALGISRDPVEATSELLESLRAGRSQSISLGRVNERWFTFTAGLGLDADAVRRVEHARAKGKASTPSRYTRCALRAFFAADRRQPSLTLDVPGEDPVEGLYLGITSNTSPWTYFRSHPIVLTPDTSFEGGLDLIALDKMGLVGTLWAAGGMLTAGGIRGRHRRVWRDLTDFVLRADAPMHLQVDGDYLGMCERAHITSVRDAIRVVA
ncbi:MAG TPA: diacylglycerol kinase family protein [Mycobacteriales bacterium]|nr:diacylglycerol kinase family protein [Mycobacteriales bacterium]HWA66679.1 diacylglycerol kinase family protein [Mycobacteriales bacterium]